MHKPTRSAINDGLEDMSRATVVPQSISSADSLGKQPVVKSMLDRAQAYLNLDILLQETVQDLRQELQADRVGIFRFYPMLDWEGVFVVEDVDPQFTSALATRVYDHCFSQQFLDLYRQGQVNAIADVHQAGLTDCYIDILQQFQIRANLAVPLLNGDELWGLLCVHQCAAPRQWQDYELVMVKQLAQDLGAALHRDELLRQSQFLMAQQRTLSAVITRIRASLDPKTIFKTTVSEIRQLLQVDRATVFRFKPGTKWNDGTFIAEAVAPGWESVLKKDMHDHCFGDRFAIHYQAGRIQAVPDIENAGFSECHVAILRQFQIRANMAVPLLKGSELWGLLCLHQCSGPRHWESYEIDFICQITEHLGMALQQAEYVQQVQDQAAQLAIASERTKVSERQEMLTATIDKIRHSLDLDIIFQTTTQEVRQLLEVERIAIYQFLPDWSGIFVAESLSAPGAWPPLVGVVPPIKDTYLQDTQGGRYVHGETFAIADIYEAGHQDCHIALLEALQVRAYVIAPIFQGCQLWGLLAVYQHSCPRSWQEDELDLLEQIGRQLGIALQQSELLWQTQHQSNQLAHALKELQQSQSQLIQGEKMAALGQLVAGVAHEINNPVNFISGNLGHICQYTQDLLNLLALYQTHYPQPVGAIQQQAEEIDLEFISEDILSTLKSMRVGVERISQIVVSLRNFSRLDEAELKPVNIHEGIDSTLVILQHRLKGRCDRPEIKIIKDYGELPLVECRPAQLNQVFMNILSNGIDALEDYVAQKSPEAQTKADPWIRIYTEVISSTDKGRPDRVLICISDNGLGISEEVRSRIFDTFFTTKPVGKGTGLGLAISYQIITEKHRGQITCLSNLGQGTEFRIELPIHDTPLASTS